MAQQEPTLTLTSVNASAATRPEGAMKPTLPTTNPSSRLARLGHILTGTCAFVAAIATAANTNIVQLMEYQAQTVFFELRGPVAPPDNIVILAIDNESLRQADNYRTDPKQYGYLEPLQAWPWKRAAYAKAIEKIMAAGARSVSLDLVLDQPSRYGAPDDQQLRQVLQRYGGKVTLAAQYEDVESHQGLVGKLTQPHRQFWTQPTSVGSINYPLERDGRIHQFSSEYRKLSDQTLRKEVANEFKSLMVATPSFDEATLTAAGLNAPKAKGTHMYFWGPSGTFKQIPFWYVLDPVNWNNYLQQGKFFKDKIVLIGPTAEELKDFHQAPFSQSWLYTEPLSGVEIHANAIASLLQGKAMQEVIPNAPLRGLVVLLGVAGAGYWFSKRKRSLTRAGWTAAIVMAWGGISYVSFAYGRLILPTAVPVGAIAISGLSYLTTAAASEQLKKRQIRQIIQRDPTSPLARELASQIDDFQDLLPQQQPAQPAASSTKKIIGGRYEITKVLGAGGFGETYIACDTQRPGNPQCVVKQLRPILNDPKHLQLARRLFEKEAEVLEKLGQHNQIPRLLAYFEEKEEFYLVQEFIDGHPLDDELLPSRQLPEGVVIDMMQEVLHILEFVHAHGVIHRDIKPSNIIRRHSDNKLVLIDFGAVKEINTQLMSTDVKSRFTVGIGTQGYAPNEQCAGRPRLNSDIYAVGITGIQGLTGLSPSQLHQDVETGEMIWADKANASPELIEVVSKMVRYDFRQRYQLGSEARADLLKVRDIVCDSSTLPETTGDLSSVGNFETPTVSWSNESTTPWSADSNETIIAEPSSETDKHRA